MIPPNSYKWIQIPQSVTTLLLRIQTNCQQNQSYVSTALQKASKILIIRILRLRLRRRIFIRGIIRVKKTQKNKKDFQEET